jgi:hypothetical protein
MVCFKKYGKCQLCGIENELTDDHVPPKGGIDIASVEIRNALTILSQNSKNSYHISQNGVKFKTICSRCNKYFMGKQYDPVLNSFAKEVGKYVSSRLYLPEEVIIQTKPNAIIRAVLGHLLAAKEKFDENDFDNEVREFLFDITKPIPESINIFYWIFPYKVTVILRDFVMPAVRSNYKMFGTFNMLKYFPFHI